MATIRFDIETGPLPADVLERVIDPFDESKCPHPGEFDPAKVKHGQTKDPEKRKAKEDAKRAEHEAAVAEWSEKIEQARQDHWDAAVGAAALHASTGRVLAIGFARDGADPQIIHDDGNEAAILDKFWKRYLACREKGIRLVGCNIFGFDLPFMFRRSLILGVPVPETAIVGRYWDKAFVDLREIWLCGQRPADCKSSLDHIARCLGITGKNGDGRDFASLWIADRPQAIEYLVNDLRVASEVAAAMKVL